MLRSDANPVANAACMEHEILKHVKGALGVALGWKEASVGAERKRDSVRFTLQSFQRHLERVMRLEEEDGYLELVADEKPHLYPEVTRLVAQHEVFRNRLKRLMPLLECPCEPGRDELANACSEIEDFLICVDEHDRREIDLLQEALLCDVGGEG